MKNHLILASLIAVCSTAHAFDLEKSFQKALQKHGLAGNQQQAGNKGGQGSPLITDVNAALNGYDEHGTVDFGGEGNGRRVVHAARKKGQPWHLIVFAHRGGGKFQMTADQEIAEAPAKGLKFAGSMDESDYAPTVRCFVNGKGTPVFGFMKPGKGGSFAHAAPGKEVVWTLDGEGKPVSLANDKVECKVPRA